MALSAPHLIALYSRREAEKALARHRPREAARHLERCLHAWPRSASAHLLAARAARLLDDYESAEQHLLECQRLEDRSSEESLLEWALFKAESGNLENVEDFLLAQAGSNPARVDLVQEALAAGYLRLYRFYEAMRCLEQCLERDPENLRALYLRGRAWERVHAYPKAAADYQEVVARDPEYDDARLRLANCLLENGEPAEALSHLELLRGRQPENPEVLVRLAFAWNALGRPGPSQELIDEVLARQPDLPSALSARGQLALEAERPVEAEAWLRKAIAANPFDRTAHYVLQQCLEQQGKKAEAEVQKKELTRVEETIDRMLTITNRLMPKTPHDPALHHELGTILMRMGKDELALSWFHSALREDPGYRPAHESLAAYYERVGDAEKAAAHRSRLAPSQKTGGER
jgi:tetratricopeptide (TPR) repeat protein